MTIHAVEDPDLDTQIADAAVATEALARRFFGDAAYLRRDVHESREAGEPLDVFEVHYCIDDWERNFGRLTELHASFMDAFVRATPTEVLARVVIDAVPTDADQT